MRFPDPGLPHRGAYAYGAAAPDTPEGKKTVYVPGGRAR